MADIIFSPTVMADMTVKTIMHIVRGSAPTEIPTYGTRLAIGGWTTLDGAVVSAETYPASVTLSVVCSPLAALSRPRHRDPREVKIAATNRWSAAYGYETGVWRAMDSASRFDYMDMYASAYDPVTRTTSGTAPEHYPAGVFTVYNAYDDVWSTYDVLRFSTTDVMSTRTEQWKSEAGVGAMGVFLIDDIVNGHDAWLLGFTTPNPMTSFGLGVMATEGDKFQLMLSDSAGVRPVAVIDFRAAFDGQALVGFKYNPDTRIASFSVRGPHTRIDTEVKIDQINGQPAQLALAALDFSLLYAQTEDDVSVLDVCMWTHCPTDGEWLSALTAYTELYGTGVPGTAAL